MFCHLCFCWHQQVQEKQLSKAYKELENANTIIKEDRAYLHNKIRGMADGFSKRKQGANMLATSCNSSSLYRTSSGK